MATSITKKQYENLKNKAFYIQQNPAQFVDTLLDALGIEVEEPVAAQGGDALVDDDV